MPISGSTMVRRQLGRRLRQLRDVARKTEADVEEANLASRVKLWHIETGRVAVKTGDVRGLCWLYRADGWADPLTELAAAARIAADRLAIAQEEVGFDVGRDFATLAHRVDPSGTPVVNLGHVAASVRRACRCPARPRANRARRGHRCPGRRAPIPRYCNRSAHVDRVRRTSARHPAASKAALVEQYGVARGTARQALAEVVGAGLDVLSQDGAGTSRKP